MTRQMVILGGGVAGLEASWHCTIWRAIAPN